MRPDSFLRDRAGDARLNGAIVSGMNLAAGNRATARPPATPGTPGTPGTSHAIPSNTSRRWTPPLCIFAHLARMARATDKTDMKGTSGAVVWIGRRCRPYGHLLCDQCVTSSSLLADSLFIDPPNPAARQLAIEMALHCPAVAVVIADGSGLDMVASRRLQLAARAGSSLLLLARPPHERGVLSAAVSRWFVAHETSPENLSKTAHHARPRWRIELLHMKGVQQRLRNRASMCNGTDSPRAQHAYRLTNRVSSRDSPPGDFAGSFSRGGGGGFSGGGGLGDDVPRWWAVEFDCAARSVVVSPDVVDRSCQETRATAPGTRIAIRPTG